MNENDRIECVVKLNRIIHPKASRVEGGQWASLALDIVSINKGEPHLNRYGNLSAAGIVPTITYGLHYYLVAQHKPTTKYPDSYEIVAMNAKIDLNDPEEQRLFLDTILTDAQIDNLYKSHPNPYELIEKHDLNGLMNIKGIGEFTAKKILNRFDECRGNMEAYVRLADYGIKKDVVDRLVEHFKSVEQLLETIENNPYNLIDFSVGFGWKKADELAQNAGLSPCDIRRVKAYIKFFFRDLAYTQGSSWTAVPEMVCAVYDALDMDDADVVRQAMYELHEEKVLWWSEDKKKIGLQKMYNLEKNIAQNLKRLMETDYRMPSLPVEKVIAFAEAESGIEYTDEQKDAVKKLLDSPVSILTGYGGTGKSSVVSLVLKALNTENFAQTALSGRAASRLGEVTGVEGTTIHRLLAWWQGAFIFNEFNQLLYDVIIVDEISMVGAELFLDLIKAVRTGAKLILIGDDGQLESIGLCNIFKDMLDCGKIPVARLTKIHRQAAKSAIITESVKVRHRQQLCVPGWVGEEVRGELQDLELNVYNNAILTQDRIISAFKRLYAEHPQINDIQIVVPMKFRGEACTYRLNNIIQGIVNPNGSNPKTIRLSNELSYTLQEGDKVIVNSNYYGAKKYNDERERICPVFNGNRGIIYKILPDGIVIDFEQWGLIFIPDDMADIIELGYALSCHKLQGSESPYVVVGFDMGSAILLTKEWLYTAITRAKQYCVVCAEAKALHYAISNSNISKKKTLLKEMMRDENV